MSGHGYIKDEMDMKIWILYILSRVVRPIDFSTLLEIVLTDEGANYFEFCQCLDALVQSGNVSLDEKDRYIASEKGCKNVAVVEDSIAFTARSRAAAAVDGINRQFRRESLIRTEVKKRSVGGCSVVMALDDDIGNLMTLELASGSEEQGQLLAQCFQKSAEDIYKQVLESILSRCQKADA